MPHAAGIKPAHPRFVLIYVSAVTRPPAIPTPNPVRMRPSLSQPTLPSALFRSAPSSPPTSPQKLRQLYFTGSQNIQDYHSTCSYNKVFFPEANTRIFDNINVSGHGVAVHPLQASAAGLGLPPRNWCPPGGLPGGDQSGGSGPGS